MLHRYLGIAVGVLLLIGFPGIVMMYLGFPRPLGAERLLTPLNINWQACCHVADDALSEGQPMARAEIEMLRGVPVLHLPRPPMPEQTINLADGSGVSTLELGEAQEVALAAMTLPIGEAPPIAAFKKAPRQLTSFSPFLYELPDRPNSRAQKPLRGWECKSAKEEREIPLVAISRLAVTALSPWQAFRRRRPPDELAVSGDVPII